MADDEQPAVRRLKLTETDVTPPPRTIKVTETVEEVEPYQGRLPKEKPYEPGAAHYARTWPFE